MTDQPLLPRVAFQYFEDAVTQNKPYIRAVGIRSCLENVVETIFVHLIDEEKCPADKWRGMDLYNKIEQLKGFFPADAIQLLHSLRKIGNKGAHQKNHANLDAEQVDVAIKDISKICEMAILEYFRKHGFDVHPWLPTVFSTLPPSYRVRILEQLYREKKTLILIDKLAMAYLKSGDYGKSIAFINECYAAGEIDDQLKSEMFEKIDLLRRSLPYLPIAKDMEAARDNLREVLNVVEERDKTLFITMVTALVADYGSSANAQLQTPLTK